MITKEKVKHVAKLARLGLTPTEIKKFQKELSLILDYIEKLKKVDVSGIEPMSHPVKVENVMKEDYYPPSALLAQPTHPKMEKIKKLLDLMPETKNGYLKVKSILK